MVLTDSSDQPVGPSNGLKSKTNQKKKWLKRLTAYDFISVHYIKHIKTYYYAGCSDIPGTQKYFNICWDK